MWGCESCQFSHYIRRMFFYRTSDANYTDSIMRTAKNHGVLLLNSHLSDITPPEPTWAGTMTLKSTLISGLGDLSWLGFSSSAHSSSAHSGTALSVSPQESYRVVLKRLAYCRLGLRLINDVPWDSRNNYSAAQVRPLFQGLASG